MNTDFIRDRITSLRIKKGKSEYQMSYDLGHSRGYINNISSGKTLPSMTEFLSICDYCNISPSEFFSEEIEDPILLRETVTVLERLSPSDGELIKQMAERLLDKDSE